MTTESPTKKASPQSGDQKAPSPAGLLQFYPLGQPPTMRFFALDRKKASLGRAEGCSIRLADEEVSRHHAFLERQGRAWTLQDNDSSNGVVVNGTRTPVHLLKEGDLLRLGNTLLLYRAFGQSMAAADCVFPLEASVLVGGPQVDLIRRMLHRFAHSDLPLLLSGETGTGKEIAAQYLHQTSPRRQGPLVPINCAAIPAPLFESQLFGHLRGAFTDARGENQGLIRQAEGGTLFLDEIGELPLELQPKLLRVMQERRVLPVGSSQSIAVDIRVVCATNQDLYALVHQGRFREDLFARINVLTLTLPPLRQRVEDIPLLAQHFIQKHAVQTPSLAVSALELLCQQAWPRNIRQLETAIQRALVLAEEERVLLPEHFAALSSEPTPALPASHAAPPMGAVPPAPLPPDRRVPDALPHDQDPQVTRLHDALRKHHGNAKLAARELGISRSQFYRWIKRWKVDLSAFRQLEP